MDKSIKLSLLTVLMWAISDTFIRYSVSELNADPMVFTFVAQISAALVLLSIAGKGALSFETFKSLRTWTHGIFSVLTTLSFVYGVSYISATQGTILGRFDIILGLLLPWIILKRNPKRNDLIGGIVVLAGIVLIVINLEEGVRIYACVAFGLNALFATLRTIDAELHPTSIKANQNIKDRCRVSGIIMLVMAVVFLMVYAMGSYCINSTVADMGGLRDVFKPVSVTFNQLALLSALVTGVFTLAPAMYFFTYAAIEAKTEKFLMIGCFLPVLTFGVESIFAFYGLLDLNNLNYLDFLAGMFIILGSLYMVVKRKA